MSTAEPNAVTHETYALRDLTFPKVLRRQAVAAPDKVFLTETASGRTFTYSELDTWTDKVAAGLESFGITQGSHTGVLMGNSACASSSLSASWAPFRCRSTRPRAASCCAIT